MFGPLFYSTLAVAVLALGVRVYISVWPAIQERREWQSLVSNLHHPDAKTVEAAAEALARRNFGIAQPYLVELARDPRGEIRAIACRSLVSVWADPTRVAAVLAAAVGDPEDGVRLEAARGYARLPVYAAQSPSESPGLPRDLRAQGLKALLWLLKDRAIEVRVAAAEALGGYGADPGVAAALAAAATGDEDHGVRFAAARALLSVNGPSDPTAVRALVALAADPYLGADRRAILDVLKGSGQEARDQALAALVGLLTTGDEDILPEVISCLQSVEPPPRAVLPALERLLSAKEPTLRGLAGMAIATIEGKQSPRAVAALIGVITDPNVSPDTRQLALGTLHESNPAALAKVAPALFRQLGDADPNVRRVAHEMLGEIIAEIPAELPDPAAKD
jgi:HEAT repeat protein